MPKSKNVNGFSKTEIKLLVLISLNFSYKLAAEIAGTDFETVKSHMRNMRERFEVNNVCTLFRIAIIKGFIKLTNEHAYFCCNAALTECFFLN